MPTVSASAPLDITFVRRQFPSLEGDCVFLDNAGGSQALGRVIDRIADYLRTTNVQLGASYAVSERAGERMQEAQRRMADETYTIELTLGDGPGRALCVTSDLGHAYIDVNAGRVTFRKYADRWLAQQTFEETTRQATALITSGPRFGP